MSQHNNEATDDLDCTTFIDECPGFAADGDGNAADPGKDSHENSLVLVHLVSQ